MSDFAKVFWSGRSQAVSLPEAYRFDTEAVRIRREGEAVILEPVRDDWADFPRLPDDLADRVLAAAEEQPPSRNGRISTGSDALPARYGRGRELGAADSVIHPLCPACA